MRMLISLRVCDVVIAPWCRCDCLAVAAPRELGNEILETDLETLTRSTIQFRVAVTELSWKNRVACEINFRSATKL